MAVSYNKLFKLLIDKKMKKKELCELAGVSASTIGKWGVENLFPLNGRKSLSCIRMHSK